MTTLSSLVAIQKNQGIQGPSGPSDSDRWLVKSSNYTANPGDKIVADTTTATFTITLPASPTTGTYVKIFDGGNWASNNLIVDPNGRTIENTTTSVALDIKGTKVDFIYDGSAWEIVSNVGGRGPTGPSGPKSFTTGTIIQAVTAPSTGTWLATGVYYSKSSYPDLAQAVGNVPDLGIAAVKPAGIVPVAFSPNNTAFNQYITATNGTGTVIVGASGAIRYTLNTDGINWTPVASQTTNSFYEVQYANGTFVAVAGAGTVAYSLDGINWTAVVINGVTNVLYSVAFTGSRWVVAGFYCLATSTDLQQWTLVPLSTNYAFYRVRYLNSTWVLAAGISGATMYSGDGGATWTYSNTGGGITWYDMLYSATTTQYYLFGASGKIYNASTMGAGWGTTTVGTDSFIGLATDGGNTIIAIGGAAAAYSTNGGSSWTASTYPSGSRTVYSIVYSGSGSIFYIVGLNGYWATTNTGGASWTGATLDPSFSSFYHARIVNSKLIGFGGNGSVILSPTISRAVIIPAAWPFTTTFTDSYHQLDYDGTKYVVAGSTGLVVQSTDGITWTSINYGAVSSSYNLNTAFYLNGYWILSGSNAGIIYYGTDLLSFSTNVGPGLVHIIFVMGLYVAATTTGIFTGATIGSLTNRQAGSFSYVAYGNGIFVACGTSPGIYSSSNGTTWTQRSVNATNKVYYINGRFFGTYISGNGISTSEDGITWIIRHSTYGVTDLIYAKGQYVAIGSQAVILSTDGLTWFVSAFNNVFSGYANVGQLAWDQVGTFVRILISSGGSSWTVLWSNNLIDWYKAHCPISQLQSVVYTNGKFIAVGVSGIAYSYDGKVWNAVSHHTFVPTAINRITYAGGKYFVCTYDGGLWQSNDAVTYTNNIRSFSNAVMNVAYGNSVWVMVTTKQTNNTGEPALIYRSTDGTNWTQAVVFEQSAYYNTILGSTTVPQPFTDITFANGNFVVGVAPAATYATQHGFTAPIMTSSDGLTWTMRSVPGSIQITGSIASDGATVIAASNSGLIKSSDGGVSWTTIFKLTANADCSYSNGFWFIGTWISTDLVNFFEIPNNASAVYSDGRYYLVVYNKTKITGRLGSLSLPQTSTGALPQSLPNFRFPYGALVTTGTNALIPMTISNAYHPNHIAEVPLYSYNTATTFFVPAAGIRGAIANYIYAKP